MSFTEMCANRISSKASFINAIRVLCLIVISFGVITNIAGMDLGALWELSDFANILMVYCNLPLQYIGFKYVLRAWKHFERTTVLRSPPKSPGCSCLFGTLWPRNTKTNIITKKIKRGRCSQPRYFYALFTFKQTQELCFINNRYA